MLLEQRIGRIDRIGQHHDDIHVSNYLYQGSVEEVVYSRLVERFKEAITIAGELQFSLLPIQPEDFEDYAKSDKEAGHIDEEELIERALRHAERIREREHLMKFDATSQKQAYEAISREREVRPLPASLQDIWQAICESEYLHTLGGRIECFEKGEAYALVNFPGVLGEVLLTVSRALFESGLGPDDQRPLHFATYGDPVFEKLLHFMIEPFADVNKTWHERERLQCICVSDHQIDSVSALQGLHIQRPCDINLSKRKPSQITEANDQVGRRQRVVLYSAAAGLAGRKLHEHDETPARQVETIERFVSSFRQRKSQQVHLDFDIADRNSVLAASSRFLWPVEPNGEQLRAVGDPLMVGVIKEIIRRQLGDMKKGSRTRADVVRNLLERTPRF